MNLDLSCRGWNGKRRDKQKRIYVCNLGDICIETKPTRQSMSPKEFVCLLKTVKVNNRRLNLLTIKVFGITNNSVEPFQNLQSLGGV